jgi:hypothetical protein
MVFVNSMGSKYGMRVHKEIIIVFEKNYCQLMPLRYVMRKQGDTIVMETSYVAFQGKLFLIGSRIRTIIIINKLNLPRVGLQ